MVINTTPSVSPLLPTESGWELVKKLLPLFLGLFFCHFGVGASLSVLPFFVKNVHRGTDIDVGSVIAAIAISVVISRPIAGRLADRIGYQRLMLFGAGLCACAGSAYAFAPNINSLIFARLLHGVGEGCVFTAGATWLVALTPTSSQGKAIGYYGVSMWLGITFGALIGAYLMKATGFSIVWGVCTTAAICGIYCILRKEELEVVRSEKKAALFPASAFGPGIALALASMGYASLASFVSLYMVQKGVENGILAFNVFGFAYVGSRLFLGHLPDQLGPYSVALGSALLEMVGLVLLFLAPNLGVAVAGGLIMGLGLSLLYPSLALIVIHNSDTEHRGAALGMFTSFWDLGIAIGGIVAGFIASHFGYSTIYNAMAFAAFLSAVGILVLWLSKRQAISPQE